VTIIPKEKVRKAYARALALGSSTEAAMQTVAQALGLPIESVEEAVSEVQ
jgi:hypothetical protein